MTKTIHPLIMRAGGGEVGRIGALIRGGGGVIRRFTVLENLCLSRKHLF